LKILVLADRKEVAVQIAKQGYKITYDPGDGFAAAVCDISSCKFVPEGVPLIVISSGTVGDWVVRRARPDAVFVDSIEEILQKLPAPAPVKDFFIPARKSLLLATYANKGGVGKTTAAVSLGFTLAQAGIKTVICDLDYGGPDVGSFFNLKKKNSDYFGNTNIMPYLSKVKENLYILPGPSDITASQVKKQDVYNAVNSLQENFPVVLCDTCPAPWEKGYLTSVFAEADLVYAVVNQSKFSIEETAVYGPQLLLMGVAPENIRIIVNQYNPKLASLKAIERSFWSGFKKELKNLPRISAVIPEDWEKHISALSKGQVVNTDVWSELCREIADKLGYKIKEKEKKNFLDSLRSIGKGVF